MLIKDVCKFHLDNARPLLGMVAYSQKSKCASGGAERPKFPLELLFEINAALDHVVRYWVDFDKDETRAADRACGHLKRLCFDVYKLRLCEVVDLYNKEIQTRTHDVVKMIRDFDSIREKATDARQEEGIPDRIQAALDRWGDVCLLGDIFTRAYGQPQKPSSEYDWPSAINKGPNCTREEFSKFYWVQWKLRYCEIEASNQMDQGVLLFTAHAFDYLARYVILEDDNCISQALLCLQHSVARMTRLRLIRTLDEIALLKTTSLPGAIAADISRFENETWAIWEKLEDFPSYDGCVQLWKNCNQFHVSTFMNASIDWSKRESTFRRPKPPRQP